MKNAQAAWIVTAVAIALLAGLISCSDDPEGHPSGEFMPLAIGSQWTYLVEPESSEAILRIENTTLLSGRQYFLTNSDLAFGQSSDGLSMARHDGGQFDDMEILFRKTSDSSFEYEYQSPWVEQPTLRVRVDPEQVVTPSGSYEAITFRVFVVDGGFQLSASFARGVGLVRMANYRGSTWHLVSFEPGDAEPNGPLQPPPAPGSRIRL
jgi:hypothetical protein